MNDVLHGDCLEVLKSLEDNSVDSIVTDPPAGIAFMGKGWDNPDYFPLRDRSIEPHGARLTGNGKPTDANGFAKGVQFDSSKHAREAFISFMTDVFTEALRVLKPGGHAFVWALPRTSHWTALALEDAGFEIRDKVFHLFGSGFPKSLDVSKALDRMAGKEREITGYNPHTLARNPNGKTGTMRLDGFTTIEELIEAASSGGKCPNGRDAQTTLERLERQKGMESAITLPATPDGQKWSGFGSALKPACEEWILVRKPLAEKSIAAQVLATGTGAINIDISRVGAHSYTQEQWSKKGESRPTGNAYGVHNGSDTAVPSKRFPSHLLLSHSLLCIPLGEKRVRANGPANKTNSTSTKNAYGEYSQRSTVEHRDDEGCEVVEAWQCAEQCPVRLLDEQSGVSKGHKNSISDNRVQRFSTSYGIGQGVRTPENSYNDQGGASRYFQTFPPFIYAPKASRRDRSSNGTVNNTHPTCKNTELMKYLVSMITPPNGVVLDMFAGSGSTGVACVQSGFRYILIEKEQEYIDIIRARLAHAHGWMWQEVQG